MFANVNVKFSKISENAQNLTFVEKAEISTPMFTWVSCVKECMTISSSGLEPPVLLELLFKPKVSLSREYSSKLLSLFSPISISSVNSLILVKSLLLEENLTFGLE